MFHGFCCVVELFQRTETEHFVFAFGNEEWSEKESRKTQEKFALMLGFKGTMCN